MGAPLAKNHRLCFSVRDDLPFLDRKYKKLAFIGRRGHLDSIDTNDPEILLVSCNWFLWQQCVHEGLSCVHMNHGAHDWDSTNISQELFNEGAGWIYADGVDVTMFRGVSLGRKFPKELSIAVADFERISNSINGLMRKYHAEEILYFEIRTDYGHLTQNEVLEIVTSIAEDWSVKFTNCRSENLSSGESFPVNQNSRPAQVQRKSARDYLALAFEITLSQLGLVRRLFKWRRSPVLVLNTQITSLPLLDQFASKTVYPLLLAQWFPNKRKPTFLLNCLRRGILAAFAPTQPLSSEDRRQISAIKSNLKSSWSDQAKGRTRFIRSYVSERILATDCLEQVARDVRWAERLLQRYRPVHILTDGLQNRKNLVLLDVARKNNVKSTATWHAHWVQDSKIDILGCDDRNPALVNNFFSWGKSGEEWLEAIGATAKPIRTGSPVVSKYASFKSRNVRERVLVLQNTIDYKDFAANTSEEYRCFVETMRTVQELGYTDTVFRLHPGVPKEHYYRDIADYFGIECEIRNSEPFHEAVEWSDITIGPAISGAMLEVLAAGKCYIPLMVGPSSVNPAYLKNLKTIDKIEELKEALTGEAFDSSEFLEDFISLKAIPNPSQCMWQAIEQDVAGNCRSVGH